MLVYYGVRKVENPQNLKHKFYTPSIMKTHSSLSRIKTITDRKVVFQRNSYFWQKCSVANLMDHCFCQTIFFSFNKTLLGYLWHLFFVVFRQFIDCFCCFHTIYCLFLLFSLFRQFRSFEVDGLRVRQGDPDSRHPPNPLLHSILRRWDIKIRLIRF